MITSNRDHDADSPLNTLVNGIVDRVIEYDATGDHRHGGAPVPGDCIRCNVVASLHPWAQRKIEAAATARRGRGA
jgi:hypothetical protein